MSRYPMALGACLTAMLLAGCASRTSEVPAFLAQPYSQRGGPPQTDLKEQVRVTLEKIQQVQKTYPLYRAAATTPGFQCVLDNNGICHVDVTVFQATDNSTGLRYCIGVAPEFVIINEKLKPKQIQWELRLISAKDATTLPWTDVTPPGSTLAFLGDEEHGILIIKNIYDGGNPNKPQLKDGKRVKWNGVDNTGFLIKNEHKANGTASYLPIIVHTEGGKPALCGSPDPIIYNVD